MKVELIRKNDAFHFDAYNEAGNVLSLDANEQIGGEGKGFRLWKLYWPLGRL